MKFPYNRKYLDRHGKRRVDYRRNGRTIPLRAPVGTPEFQAAYDAAKAHAEREQQTTRPPTTSPRILQPGTFGWLCAVSRLARVWTALWQNSTGAPARVGRHDA